MKKMLFILTLSLVSPCVFAATPPQIKAALEVTTLSDINSIAEDKVQPRCPDCRVLIVSGRSAYESKAWQKIEVDGDGSDQYSAKIIGQSR